MLGGYVISYHYPNRTLGRQIPLNESSFFHCGFQGSLSPNRSTRFWASKVSSSRHNLLANNSFSRNVELKFPIDILPFCKSKNSLLVRCTALVAQKRTQRRLSKFSQVSAARLGAAMDRYAESHQCRASPSNTRTVNVTLCLPAKFPDSKNCSIFLNQRIQATGSSPPLKVGGLKSIKFLNVFHWGSNQPLQSLFTISSRLTTLSATSSTPRSFALRPFLLRLSKPISAVIRLCLPTHRLGALTPPRVD